MEWKDKNVMVFGTGLSGMGAAALLEQAGAKVLLYDGNKNLTEREVLDKLPAGSKTRVQIGEMPEEILDTIEVIIMSPGVPLDIPVIERAKLKKIPVWGEVELAYRMGKGTVLAITGTNGKTTTTALLGAIMRDYASSVFVVGNIGTPYTSVALETTDQSYVVAEISSFQLETTAAFAPKVSAILNITEDHLNRHHTMEEYIRVKEMIAANQKEDDVCVLNYEDQVLREYAKTVVPRPFFFSSLRKLEEGIYLDGDSIVLRQYQKETAVVRTGELKLLGRHNHENVMAAVAMAYFAGVPMESIQKSICAFTAVEHRIEYVAEKEGVRYYNDSKGTNPDAAIKGIQAMNRPTLLIGGGYDKASAYEEWIQSFQGNVRYLVLIGQTREKILRAALACGFTHTILADSLKEAVEICARLANPGDAVLLSPACASWGQFDNYEQRGNMFKEYVHRL